MFESIHKEYSELATKRGYYEQKEWKVLEVAGKDREKFLHNLLSQHVQDQAVGERRWSTILNSKGRVIGFFEVWKLSERFLILVHQAQAADVLKSLETYWITEDLHMKWLDEVEIVSTFILSKEILLEGYPYEMNKIVQDNLLRCLTDDYFIPSVTMIVSKDQKQNITNHAFPVSEELYESIRIKSQFPLPSIDYTDPIPIEVPFMHRAISFTKGCYVGQETIARLHARGLNVSRKLLFFSTDEKANILPNDSILQEQKEVGKVSSVAPAPEENKKIGLGWIHRNAFGKSVAVNHQTIVVSVGVEDKNE